MENGKVLDRELSRSVILEKLSQRMHQHAFEALPEHSRIHAASGFAGDRFFIICGDKYAGKSTLALKLLYEGLHIVGDELVLLRGSEAVTFPRKMYMRSDCRDLIPSFKRVAEDLPFVSNETDYRIFAFDPLIIDRPWRIRPAKLGAVFYIEPNHGGRSRLRACGKLEMVQRILTQASGPISSSWNWIGDITAAVDQADSFIVDLGDLDSAAIDLKNCLRYSD